MAAVLTTTDRRVVRIPAERRHLRAVPDPEVLDRAEAPRGLIAVGCVILFLVFGSFTVINGRGGFADVAAEPQYRPAPTGAATVVVERGDTLWSIARSLQPEGDVRPLVDKLTSLNGTLLRPGQVVILPS